MTARMLALLIALAALGGLAVWAHREWARWESHADWQPDWQMRDGKSSEEEHVEH